MATIDDFGGSGQALDSPPLGGPNGWAAAVRDMLRELEDGLPNLVFEVVALDQGLDPTVTQETAGGVTTVTIGVPDGATGTTGATPSLSIGTVTTGVPAATLTGTEDHPVLNLVLPAVGTDSIYTAAIQAGAVTAAKIGALTTKGDLLARDGSGAVRLPVGADGSVLQSDAGSAAGVRWGAEPAAKASIGNLLSDDQANGAGGISALYNCTVADAASWDGPGDGAQEITCTGAGHAVIGTTTFDATEGVTYTAAVHVQASTTPRPCHAVVVFRDGDGDVTGSDQLGPVVTSTSARVTAATAQVTAPAGTTQAEIRLSILNPAASEMHFAGGLGFWVGDGGQWSRPGVPVTGLRGGATVPTDSLRLWGHSYIQGAGPGVTDASRLSTVLAEMLGLPERNEGIGGATAFEDVNAGGGSVATVLQKVTRPATRWAGPGGAHVLMWGINDLNKLGNTASDLRAAFAAYRAAISRLRQGAIFEDSHSSVTFGAVSWEAITISSYNSGTTLRYGSTGGTVTITTPQAFPGGTLVLGVVSWGAAGAAMSGSVNGQTYEIDTRDWPTAYNVPGVLRIPNVPAGSAAYTFTVTAATPPGMVFDYWGWEAPEEQCPVIALIKSPKPLDYDAYGSVAPGPPTDAGIDALNAGLDAIAAEFGDRVVTVDTSLIDKAAYYWSAGDVHPNAAGNHYIAAQVAAALRPWTFVTRPDLLTPRTDYGPAAPTGLSTYYPAGSRRTNTAPAEAGTTGSKYVATGWVCTVAGAPGTWVPLRSLTGN